MANNRLFLTCVRCGSDITIARLQVGMESTWLPSRTREAAYEEWLETHSHCGNEPGGLSVRLTSESGLCVDVRP